jgi:hypothetical protein
MVFEGTVPIAIESFVSTLKHVSRTFSGHESVAVAASRIDALLRGLDTAAFSVRLKRWVGSWEFGDEELDSDGVRLFRGEIEIRRLAKAGAEDPTLVTPALLEWLVSPEAKRSYDFFYRLGQLDSDWRWQSMVENMGESDAGARAFSCYFGGRASQRPAEVEDRLDHFAASGLVRASAIVDATGFLPGSMRAIRRVLKLLNEGGVEAVSVERRLMGGGWMTPINSDEAAVLMQGIAGEDFSGAALVIDFLAMWVHHNKPIDGQLAEVVWRALDTAPEGGEAWDYDRVAAAIAGTNIDRAFDLLFMYLTLPHNRQSWEPLDRHGGNRFWNFLWQANPQRCIDVLLRAKTASPLFSWRIGWHLPEILDLVRDHEVLLAFAQQGEANAEFVASCLSSKEGFWPLALSILAFHPENENIRRYVTGAVQHTNRVTIGPASERYRVWADELEAQAASASTPDTVRPFLRDLSEQLLRRSQDERRSEADEQVNW